MDNDRAADEGLMALAARDNREALGTLLRRYASPLLTFIQRMIGDRHRAEELLQEVFLTVWKRRRSYQYPRPFRLWVFGIAMIQCRNDFRRQASSRIELEEEPIAALVAGDPSPEEVAIAAETTTAVAAAVATLPPDQRTVLVLRVWNGLEYREIAQMLDRTEATVRSHMCHALAALRRRLERRPP